MVNRMRRLGMVDTKAYCGCSRRGVFIDAFGNAHRHRMHKKECKYYKVHYQGGKYGD